MNVVDELAALYADRALGSYFGEQVSMLEHGLQAAWFATQEGATSAQVVAALLHDVGHLVEEVPADLADWKSDAHHEDVGAAWLSRHFDPEVTEPIALHVAAKRYLCATEPPYFARLSPASVVTLRLQGGPMSPAEVRVRGAVVPPRGGAIAPLGRPGKAGGLLCPGLRRLSSDHRGTGTTLTGSPEPRSERARTST